MLRRSRALFNPHGLKNLTEGPCFIQCRSICYSSPRTKYFAGEETFGDLNKGPSFSEVFRRIWDNPKLLKEQFKDFIKDVALFSKELSDRFNVDPIDGLKGEIDMLFTFEDDSSIKKFRVITDKTTMNGWSTASFIRTQYDSGLFTGCIDHTLPKDGISQYSGFAGIMTPRLTKSFGRPDTYNFDPYTHIVLKVRGDGRSYTLILGCPGKYDITWQDQYHYPIFTRGGPYWQLIKIPFSNFYFTCRGNIQDQQTVMDSRQCSRIGITASGFEGPFKLEIDYIGLEHQPFHKSITPYESYFIGKNVAT